MIFLQKTTINLNLIYRLIACFAIGVCSTAQSQNTDQNKDSFILDKFEAYAESPREYIYAHLNKSVLLKGEMLGFTAYVFDKSNKNPSLITRNLYGVISDSLNNPIAKKLLHVKNGVAENVFNIDSLFTSGTYKISLFTNHTLNFNDEKNYFSQEFVVIDPKVTKEIKKTSRATTYTIDVLPEGGHLIYDTQNVVGIIVKDDKGFGLKNKTGYIKDNNHTILTEFKLDNQGIAKCLIKPLPNQSYFVTITDDEGLDLKKPITDIDTFGFNIAISSLRDKIIISLRTNQKTLAKISSNTYKMTIHNGFELLESNLSFNNKLEVSKVITKSNLFAGMNIITIFDAQNRPLLERLYLNLDGINRTHLNIKSVTEKKEDSLHFVFTPDKAIDTSKVSHISVSILPKDTKAYNFSSNMLSRLYLEPFLRGQIENAAYYFSSNSPKVLYDLDNLLISQGWSSYDWTAIFNRTPLINKEFEYGIAATVNINNKKKSASYISYPLKNNASEIFVLDNNDKQFYQNGLFPLENETYRISENNAKRKPSLYINFSPSLFPSYDLKPRTILNPENTTTTFIASNKSLQDNSWNKDKVEKLDEVVVMGNLNKTRIEELERKYLGTVDVISDRMKKSNFTMGMYLTTKGFIVQERPGIFNVLARNAPNPRDPRPAIFFNDILLADLTLLSNFWMADVDYVIINKQGGTGPRSINGEIRIYESQTLYSSDDGKNLVSSHEFPLTFSPSKEYYTPKYQNYTSDFFNEYGTISWHPNILDKNGTLNLTAFNTGLETVNLYIEGFINGNTFISQVKTLNLKQ